MFALHLRARSLAVAVCIFCGVTASPAFAGVPTTVTVRVQGVNGATLVPQKQVTTNTAPVPVEGGSCSGTSVGGALYGAVNGNWKAYLVAAGVEIVGIDGLTFPRFSENPGIYWAVWINSKYALQGACSEELTSSGEHVVFVAQCYEAGADCASKTQPDHFLTMTPPSATSVNVGEAVSVTIGSVSTESGSPEPSLPAGINVTAGSLGTSPGAGGVATFTFSTAGTYTLQASAPDSVTSDSYTVCVHNGSDGSCGTSSAAGLSGSSMAASGSTPYTGPFAVVADVTGLRDGRHYSRRHAPRTLSGSVTAPAPISNVELRLTRAVRTSDGRSRCSYYDGVSERFRSMRCGAAHGKFFVIGRQAHFSYLLPFRLPRGRYVLDVQAADTAGSRTQLARGSSRIVFYVT
jgi:hypothetical protein